MRELAPSLSVPRIHQSNGNGHAAPPDPMREAVVRRRELMATRMEEATASQLSAQEALEARRLEAEAVKAELEIEKSRAGLEAIRAERQKLAAAGQAQGGGDAFAAMGAMLQMFQASQQQLMEAAAKQHEGLLVLLNDRIEAAQQAQQAPAPAPLPTLAERVAELKALLDITEQLRPKTAEVSQGMSVHDRLALEKFHLEADERRHQLAEQSAIRLRELQGLEQHRNGELALRERQVAAEIGRNEQFANLVQGAAPGIAALIQKQLAGEEAQGGAAPAQAAPEQVTCQSCGEAYLIRPEARGHMVRCPHCSVVTTLPAT